MGFGLMSLPHQQWYVPGSSFTAELQPGHLQVVDSVCRLGCSSVLLRWLRCHFLTQLWWTTVQQVEQDHTREFGRTSFVQMTHSYWLLVISSWILVGKSGAVDFDLAVFCRTRWGTSGFGRLYYS
jgi:hypothetical protein